MTNEELAEILRSEGHEVLADEGRDIRWRCRQGHERRSKSYDLKQGRRCFNCRRIGGRPPQQIAMGTRSGDLEIVEMLGVIDGHSRFRVRNVTNAREAVMTGIEFRTQKRQLLDETQLHEILVQNGKKSKGRSKPGNARWTWGDIIDRCQKLGATFLHPVECDGLVFRSLSPEWKFRCQCGSMWTPTLNNLMSEVTNSCGCVRSKPQSEVNEFIHSLGFETGVDNRQVLRLPGKSARETKHLDIYIESKKIGVEYCGLYWHGEVLGGVEARTKHLEKLRLCEEQGIRLVTIFEDEWIQRRVAVEGYLRAILGAKTEVVGARNCEITDDDQGLIRDFHLQGDVGGEIHALAKDGVVVAAARFARGNPSRSTSIQSWELARYCVRPGLSVPGGLSRLIASFGRAHPDVESLVSYSDSRWSRGDVYRKLGFDLVSENKPSYWYFQKHHPRRYHRFKWRKSEAVRVFGGDSEQTEWEIVSAHGWDRIWDCGTRTWSLNLNAKTP